MIATAEPLQVSYPDLVALQASVSKLRGVLPAMVHNTYDRFAAHPDTAPGFLADRDTRERTLAQFFGDTVFTAIMAGNVRPLVTAFERLGVVHGSIGMSPALMRAAGPIFVESMADAVGPDWGESFTDAWGRFFDQTAEIMVAAAA